MKKFLIISFIALLSLSCSNSSANYYNEYLPVVKVDFTINLDLPEAQDLRFLNGVYVTYNHGISGVAIRRTGTGYEAFELTCPNHPIESSCSILRSDKNNSLTKYCYCFNHHHDQPFGYSLVTGAAEQGKQKYGLKRYNVYQNGNLLTVRY